MAKLLQQVLLLLVQIRRPPEQQPGERARAGEQGMGWGWRLGGAPAEKTLSDRPRTAPIASGLDLPEQHRRHVLAIPPALGQIWQERIERGRVMITAAHDLASNLSRTKLPDRPPVQVESAGNSAQAQALRQQRVDLGMPLLRPRRLPTSRGRRRGEWRSSRWDLLRLQLRTQHGQRARREAFQCLRKIVREVPAISYLKGAGCATSCSVGIHTTTVAADDLHIGMLMVAEPIHQGISRRILQQVDDAVSCGIHQNRAVTASATKRKFVNPEHPWRLDGLLRERSYQTHQRGAARRHR